MTAPEITDPGDGAEPEAPETEETEPEGGDWESHAKSLRKESAKYRTRAKELESKYAWANDERAASFVTAGQMMANGDTAAVAEWVVRNAANALGVDVDVLMALAEGDEEETEDVSDQTGLSPDQIQQMVAEEFARQQQSLTEQQTMSQAQAVHDEIDQMGHAFGTPEHEMILWFAVNETQGDLGKAKARLDAYLKAPVDSYIAQKREEARGQARQTGGQAPGSERKIKDINQASAAALEYFDQQG